MKPGRQACAPLGVSWKEEAGRLAFVMKSSCSSGRWLRGANRAPLSALVSEPAPNTEDFEKTPCIWMSETVNPLLETSGLITARPVFYLRLEDQRHFQVSLHNAFAFLKVSYGVHCAQ